MQRDDDKKFQAKEDQFDLFHRICNPVLCAYVLLADSNTVSSVCAKSI